MLMEIYIKYPHDNILPGFDLEFDDIQDEGIAYRDEDMRKFFTTGHGINVRCVECPESRDGGYQEWKLANLEISQDPKDKEWVKCKRHLGTVRHRACVDRRLGKLARFQAELMAI